MCNIHCHINSESHKCAGGFVAVECSGAAPSAHCRGPHDYETRLVEFGNGHPRWSSVLHDVDSKTLETGLK